MQRVRGGERADAVLATQRQQRRRPPEPSTAQGRQHRSPAAARQPQCRPLDRPSPARQRVQPVRGGQEGVQLGQRPRAGLAVPEPSGLSQRALRPQTHIWFRFRVRLKGPPASSHHLAGQPGGGVAGVDGAAASSWGSGDVFRRYRPPEAPLRSPGAAREALFGDVLGDVLVVRGEPEHPQAGLLPREQRGVQRQQQLPFLLRGRWWWWGRWRWERLGQLWPLGAAHAARLPGHLPAAPAPLHRVRRPLQVRAGFRKEAAGVADQLLPQRRRRRRQPRRGLPGVAAGEVAPLGANHGRQERWDGRRRAGDAGVSDTHSPTDIHPRGWALTRQGRSRRNKHPRVQIGPRKPRRKERCVCVCGWSTQCLTRNK